MPTSEKNILLESLHRMPFTDDTINFNELLIEKSRLILGKSPIDAEQWAHVNAPGLWNDFRAMQDSNINGIISQFVIEDVNAKKFRFVRPTDFQGCPNKCSLLRARPYILQEIDKFTSRQYEALAVYLCILLGADKYLLTPPGNEGGVDFYASVRFSDSAHYIFGIKGPVRIIGQSKKYSNKVEDSKVKEFLFTLEAVKTQSAAIMRKVPPWFYASQGHVLGWIVAHKGFQSGAVDRSKNHGVLLADSREVAQVLALSKKFFPSRVPSERAQLLTTKINELL